jgi:hypothetical protein
MYAIPDISRFVTKSETWEGGNPIALIYSGSPSKPTAPD